MRNSTTYKIAGTKTFRLGSSKILGYWGGNLQNIEKSMRQIYVPDDGKIFVQVDQSGAEALIVAYLCRHGRFRELFQSNIKPHVYVALRLFKDVWAKKMREAHLLTADTPFCIDEIVNTPISQLKNLAIWPSLNDIIKDSDNWSFQERYYYLAKQTCHSGNYSVGVNMFRMNILDKSGGKIVLDKESGEMFLLTYNSLFDEIPEWHEETKRIVNKTGVLYNLHGHPYVITQPEILDSKWKELFAWVPQSTVGEITNIAFTRMQQHTESENLKWDLLANTHDSYMIQCPIGDERLCAKTAQEFMAQKFVSPVDGVEFQMRSEACAGFNWCPYHKDKNPEGLREIKV